MAKYCCICKKLLENENAPILAMSAYGSPKCICESCENIIDTATTSRDAEEITEACKSLGEALTRGDTGDTQIIDSVNDIIKSASERGEAIKDGTYDFALDEKADDEEEFDITEDLEETEEDRKKDEKDEKVNKIVDTVLSWVAGLAILGAVVFFIIKFVI